METGLTFEARPGDIQLFSLNNGLPHIGILNVYIIKLIS